MANKILKPRRGLKSTAIRKGIVLRKGEIFFEVPDSGVGTGVTKVKLGDGYTSYENLPYAIDPEKSGVADLGGTLLEFEELDSDNISIETALENINTGNSLGNIIRNIKVLFKKFKDTLSILSSGSEGQILIFKEGESGNAHPEWIDPSLLAHKMGYGFGTAISNSDGSVFNVDIEEFELVPGGLITVKFNQSVPAGAQLNINNTGEKIIVTNGSTPLSNGVISGNDRVLFVYEKITEDYSVFNILAINQTNTLLVS